MAEIWAYMAMEASEETATRFVGSIETTIGRLRQAPRIGAPRPVLGPDLRALFHPPYAIYYLVHGEAETIVTVVRVLHGARDIAAIAERGELEP